MPRSASSSLIVSSKIDFPDLLLHILPFLIFYVQDYLARFIHFYDIVQIHSSHFAVTLYRYNFLSCHKNTFSCVQNKVSYNRKNPRRTVSDILIIQSVRDFSSRINLLHLHLTHSHCSQCCFMAFRCDTCAAGSNDFDRDLRQICLN